MNMDFPHNEISEQRCLERIDHANLMALLAAQHAFQLIKNAALQDSAPAVDQDPMQSRLRLFAARARAGVRDRRTMPTGAFHPGIAMYGQSRENYERAVYPSGSAFGKAALVNLAMPSDTDSASLGQCPGRMGTAENWNI